MRCFAGKPLAVCHSNSAQGSAEVSSANYEARAFGIRAGMFMSDAKARCPGLLVVPYEFDKYEEISEQVCEFGCQQFVRGRRAGRHVLARTRRRGLKCRVRWCRLHGDE